MSDLWTYCEGVLGSDVSTRNLVGYGVEAEDGSLGTIDEWTWDVGSSRLGSLTPARGSSARR